MLRFLIGFSIGLTLLAALVGYQPPRQALDPPAIQRVVPARPTTSAAPVAIDQPEAMLLGADDFDRSSENSWQAALKGGEYTLLGPSVDFAVGSGAGSMRTPSGATRGATLLGVRARDVDLRVRIQSDRLADGGDQFVFLTIRRVDDATSYLARVRFDTAHTAWLQAGRTVGASTQMLGSEARVPEFTHAPSSALWVRAAAAGDAPTTLGLKAWPDGRPEPESWQYAGSDSEASLRAAGAVALQTYVSSRTTNAPVTFRFSQFSVAPADPTTLAISAVAFPTPTAEPRATLATPTPAPAPTPSVDQAWTALQTDLEAAWGTDTPRTIALLDAFLTRFPGHAAAREKLYAALVSSAADLSSAGEPDRAAQRLEQARDLIPSRGEALAALAGLTPTPVPVPVRLQPAPAVVQPNQPPAPPVARGPVSTRASAPAPAPASRVSSVRPPAPPPARPAAPAAAQPAAPTPTKVPFVPPRIGP